jgi:hypothetical protein
MSRGAFERIGTIAGGAAIPLTKYPSSCILELKVQI